MHFLWDAVQELQLNIPPYQLEKVLLPGTVHQH